jgi:hypothetical protein
VAGFNRNGWPTSVGFSGRLASDYALTAEEVVTYCGILSAIDSWEARRPAPTVSPPVGNSVPPPGGERGTSNVYVLGSRDRAAGRGVLLQQGSIRPRNAGFFRVQSYLPQSSSASRLTAGASGFLNLSQSDERPDL